MRVNLPTALLRSFVAIVDNGSMLSAADRVFVTQSALSLQIKRLEELVQQSLFVREGRRLTLTPPGEVLLDYARRLLSLHDEGVAALSSGASAGPARIGMVQDFADNIFTGVLTRFAELHPESPIYARVAGTAELKTLLDKAQLDVIVGFSAADDPFALCTAPMSWYGDADLTGQDVLPLAVLEPPCRFREAAVASLEAAGRSYRITVETPNLSTLRAAVQARLGVTCRTHLFLYDMAPLGGNALPNLPHVGVIIDRSSEIDAPTKHLSDLTVDVIRQMSRESITAAL